MWDHNKLCVSVIDDAWTVTWLDLSVVGSRGAWDLISSVMWEAAAPWETELTGRTERRPTTPPATLQLP